jgi:hypothetical protein
MAYRCQSIRWAVEPEILNEMHIAMSRSAAIRISFLPFLELKTTC